ncbi:helix-turn-helix transcriptional regulator [Lichenifustis flavocetrariae]|uniref:LuxR family transcriptional regulator n=1 Tax=Lichenifustis flavocetrariae TaxID=2949735 RepID=A0AA41Z191_9HYPH|nr:LuxR family transcriptional regulator [Lichenifustis flavocetrariae]MCW6512344.1 LuxR family transcriptional regulator [Lichenifustis flavocetrariae]
MITLPKSWQFIRAIEAARDGNAITAVLVKIAKQYGFTSVFGGLIPNRRSRPGKADVRSLVMVQHFPAEWAKRYNECDYLFRDPVLHRLRSDLNPFQWQEAYASCPVESDAKLVGGGAAEFGLRDGYVVPVNTLDHRLAAVSFGGGHVDLSPDDATALGFAVTLAVGQFLKLQAPSGSTAASLTVREWECLHWASEGKTDWDISVLLGISRSTVTKHIAAAREKLGALNKTHAIAIAFRKRLFE